MLLQATLPWATVMIMQAWQGKRQWERDCSYAHVYKKDLQASCCPVVQQMSCAFTGMVLVMSLLPNA